MDDGNGMQTLRRGLTMRILSVRPSNAWIVTKRKKDMFRFLHDTKDNLSYFSEKKNGWWGGDPFYHRWSEIADFEQIITRPLRGFQ